MRIFILLIYCLSSLLLISSCSTDTSRPGSEAATTPASLPTSSLAQAGGAQPAPTDPLQIPTLAPTIAPATAMITVQADGPTRPFSQRLLGTNVPAWLGAATLSDPAFQALTVASGTSLLRLPGGSWSNHYNWLACETGDDKECAWPWAARPTDLLNFLRATGIEGMWTVSFNGTALEAAALVAFFNGSSDNETPIGVDPRGRDWKTVGYWARLRAEHGNPEPLPIKLWEVGNEIYGAKPASAGPGCAAWGWEDVWTCDGSEYVTGKGAGAERREGYLEFRAAMRAVDPSIQVGAVGVDRPGDWSGWGDKVIAGAGDSLDFYIVHLYPYSETPTVAADVLAQPGTIWPRVMRELRGAFAQSSGGRDVPVAVTEYNLVAFQDLDSQQMMRRAVNALFLADTIGQLAEQGVTMANQWNLANGRAENGTDYGLIDPKSKARNPAFYALALWSRFGTELLPVRVPVNNSETLSVYAGRDGSGAISLLVINKTERALDSALDVAPGGSYAAQADTLQAESLMSEQVRFNGVADPTVDLANAPARELGTVEGPFDYSFPPVSITLIRLTPSE